jgi:hypothetical protein
MNHFDDRASYFAFLRDQGRLMDCLDNNQQQDRSLLTYGGEPSGRVVMGHDTKQDA